ncbi:MAG TPA: hypothetical protein ENL03_02340 [Phycisphaerae bacterium]|nr:hypothetical protein [Phycisphaerae bacterium]
MQGGETWQKYHKDISAYLIKMQLDDGSWSKITVLGDTYDTAIALMILQMPMDRLATFQPPAAVKKESAPASK